MKNIDFKSIIIGALMVICFMLFTGQRSSSMGDIVVDSIEVKNDGYIKIFNDKNEVVAYFGQGESKTGAFFETYNNNGQKTVYLGTTVKGDGMLLVKDKYSDNLVYLGTEVNDGGGLVQTYYRGENWSMIGSGKESGFFNLRKGTENVIVGAGSYDDLNFIYLTDNRDNIIWSESSE